MTLREAGESADHDRDLLVVALSGVQQFIAESRTTADLRAGSAMIARLSDRAAQVLLERDDVELVFPVHRSPLALVEGPGAEGLAEDARADGVPNRIVALTPAGAGPLLAGKVVAAVREKWADWLQKTFDRAVDTPGMPSVQWVCVPAAGHADYAAQWRAAQPALVARRRVRDFDEVHEVKRRLCTLSPRWAAEARPPPRVPVGQRDTLSAANWVKRRLGRRGGAEADQNQAWVGFPSTSSIASATFRLRVLHQFEMPGVRDDVAALRAAVRMLKAARETGVAGLLHVRPDDDLAQWFATSAGVWVYPETWHPVSVLRECGVAGQSVDDFADPCRAGQTALKCLLRRMDPDGEAVPPPSYLALLAQDLDGMGRFLSGEGHHQLPVTAASHRCVSDLLVNLGPKQASAIVKEVGVPVYAGGDDLLAFTPASTALAAARACHDLVPLDDLPRASTAVLFFHRSSSLRRAVGEARVLLKEAKAADEQRKHALAVGFLRRSGVREHSIQPWHPARPGLPDSDWDGKTSAELFAVFTRPVTGRGLSPRLVSVLERDAYELSNKNLGDDLFEAELRRLVRRHGGSIEDADALLRLGAGERVRAKDDVAVRIRSQSPGGTRVPARAARVAVFLRQECGQATP